MFAGIIKSACFANTTCNKCQFENICYALSEKAAKDWDNKDVERCNRLLDMAIAKCVREVRSNAAD